MTAFSGEQISSRQNGHSGQNGLNGSNGARNGAGLGAEAQTEGRTPAKSSDRSGDKLAKGLGLFSIGLGIAEIAAPGSLGHAIGLSDSKTDRMILRAFGLREFSDGIGILTMSRPAGWLWGRVGGDLLDLSYLGRALASRKSQRNRVMLALAAVAGVTALDLLASTQVSSGRAQKQSRSAGDAPAADHGLSVRQAITVNRPPSEVYQFWHNFENLPRFMDHLESVQVTGDGRSHWKAKGPAGKSVEWDAEMTEDQPNRRIAWRSLPGADVENAGVVEFQPAMGGKATEVSVQLRYNPPAGVIGATVAKLFGREPNQQIHRDLRPFKQLLETGEVTKSDATVHGHPHPAQPSNNRPGS